MGLKSGFVTWIKLVCGLLEGRCFSPYRCYNVQTRTAGRRHSDLWPLWAESCCRCPSPAPRHHQTHWKLLCRTATGWPAPGEKTHSYHCVVFLCVTSCKAQTAWCVLSTHMFKNNKDNMKKCSCDSKRRWASGRAFHCFFTAQLKSIVEDLVTPRGESSKLNFKDTWCRSIAANSRF